MRYIIFLSFFSILFFAKANAHQLAYPKVDKLQITKDAITLNIHYALAAGENSKKLRKQFDQDRSGQIDEKEADKLLNFLEISLKSSVSIRLNGKRVFLQAKKRQGDAILGKSDRKNPLGIEVDLHAALPQKTGIFILEIFDRSEDTNTPVPISILWKETALPLLSSTGQIDFVSRRLDNVLLDGSSRLKVSFLLPE